MGWFKSIKEEYGRKFVAWFITMVWCSGMLCFKLLPPETYAYIVLGLFGIFAGGNVGEHIATAIGDKKVSDFRPTQYVNTSEKNSGGSPIREE